MGSNPIVTTMKKRIQLRFINLAKMPLTKFHKWYISWIYRYMESPQADPKFLMESGCLAKINHAVLHPVGLAMWIDPENGGMGVFDSMDDPEGYRFSDETKLLVMERLYAYNRLLKEKSPARSQKLGYIIQPMSEINLNEQVNLSDK